MGNLMIVHGGGPTAVINASLFGAVQEAKKHPEIKKIYGAAGGTGGLLKRRVIDLGDIAEEKLNRLLSTPGSAIGTSRDALEKEDYAAMAVILKELAIDCVLLNGGNGTMDTCGKLCDACAGTGIRVMGIPKTMDNDIAITDHSPGFGSAARFAAGSMAELIADVRGLPIHLVVVEFSGRNAGWITAASALAADSGLGGPDLIYLPERDFSQERFLTDAKQLIQQKGFGVIAVSEGLHRADGSSIVPPIFKVGRATYFGDVASHLANLVIRELGCKARGEKPGLLGRASIAWQSDVDRDEAVLAGTLAARAVIGGESGRMVGFKRLSTVPYAVEPILIDTHEVMLTEKKMPENFINSAGNGVTKAFMDWCRPLIGAPLPAHTHFAEYTQTI